MPDEISSSTATLWNRIVAASFLVVSLWTLIADVTYGGHILLQSSFSTLFLGVGASIWIIAAIVYAGFPKRFVIPALILITLRLSFAWPLTLMLDLRTAVIALDASIVVVAVLYLSYNFVRSAALQRRKPFRWQHSAGTGAFWILISVLTLPLTALGIAKVIEQTSLGYVGLTPKGIFLTERIFEKESTRVHLIGVAHIADGTFYKRLNQSFAQPVEGKRLVLTEGVADANGILPQSFASGKTYGDMAKKLGLDEQKRFGVGEGEEKKEGQSWVEKWEAKGVRFQNADIDISELSEIHQEGLITILKSMEGASFLAMFMAPPSLSGEEVEDLIVEGLVKSRNAKLMEVFDEEVADYAEIYMPWGAAHLPDVEDRLLARGYVEVEETRHLGISFWKGRKSGE